MYSLAASIVADNHGQWMEELDHIDVPAVKGTAQDLISKWESCYILLFRLPDSSDSCISRMNWIQQRVA